MFGNMVSFQKYSCQWFLDPRPESNSTVAIPGKFGCIYPGWVFPADQYFLRIRISWTEGGPEISISWRGGEPEDIGKNVCTTITKKKSHICFCFKMSVMCPCLNVYYLYQSCAVEREYGYFPANIWFILNHVLIGSVVGVLSRILGFQWFSHCNLQF